MRRKENYMYSNNLAVAIKSSGKVLREFDDQVFLPFGSEYSIFVKNKNTVRASVKIEIDGVDVTQGVSLVVNPNDEIELERFIKNGNLVNGNRFKFIERTAQIENHRGIKVEDGLVRIEFQFEKPRPILTVSPNCYDTNITWNFVKGQGLTGNCVSGSTGHISTTGYVHPGTLCSVNAPRGYSSTPVNSVNQVSNFGITAPGSVSNQEFNTVSTFDLESRKHVIILRLMGQHQGKTISKTVTTRSRTECVTCGHVSKSTASKFCSNCGTSLQIIG